MSSDSPSLLRFKEKITPTIRMAVFTWAVLGIGAYVLMSISSANTTALRDDIKNTNNSLDALRTDHESGNPELQTELDRARQKLSLVTDRIARMESALGGETGISDRGRVTQSELAVRKADAAKHAAIANAAVRDLGKLKNLQREWAALEATLMNGQAGSRIAGSGKHFLLVVDIWQRQRPMAEQIVAWEGQLTPLTEPFIQAGAESTTLSITDEHAKRLSDLGEELKTQAVEFERQKLLLESDVRETSGLQPAVLPLVDAIEQHRGQQEQAEADRLAAFKATAKAQADKEIAERIAKSERERADATAKVKEQEDADEKQRLAARAKQLEEDRKWAKLEAEMQRDMNEIKGLLLAYTAPGFAYRPDDKKGPVSYSLIKSSGGLEPTHNGLGTLFSMGRGNADRPQGGLPRGNGGVISSGTPLAPIERAQGLLIKYGELMVRKEMLAP
ncbi:MAG: hypothetical protein O2856_14665 [Planctomycetota bacterium]|nr:hypothetical protein [Planctomycetota bacterium]